VLGHAAPAHEGVRQADLPLRPGPARTARPVVTPQQANLLQQAIDNQRLVKKLMRAWEEQTERLIDLEAPRHP
jgi:hypothetical protein